MPRLTRWYQKLKTDYHLFNKLVAEPGRWSIALAVVLIPLVLYGHLEGEPLKKLIRWHATGLQVLGLVLVAKGFSETAPRFGRKKPWERFKSWVQSIPKKKPRAHVLSASPAAYSSASGSLTLEVHDANPTLEQRVDRLAKELTDFKADHERVTQDIRRNIKAVTTQLDSVATELKKDHESLKEKVNAQLVGGLDEGYMGLGWVFFGTVLSGLTDEVVCFLGWFHRL